MKKVLFIAMLALGIAVNAQEGEFNVGANIGLPVGDISDFSGFAFNIEGNYLFEVADQIKVGPSLSYLHFFSKDVEDVSTGNELTDSLLALAGEFGVETSTEVSDFSFIPIAAAGRYEASEQFTLGLDLGYAIGVSEGIDGGLYFRPLVGYNINENIMAQLTYTGVSQEGVNASAITIGAVFGL